jgi:hypothetical protein
MTKEAPYGWLWVEQFDKTWKQVPQTKRQHEAIVARLNPKRKLYDRNHKKKVST